MAKGCGKSTGKSSNTASKTYKTTPAKKTGGEKTPGGKAAYNAPIKPKTGY